MDRNTVNLYSSRVLSRLRDGDYFLWLKKLVNLPTKLAYQVGMKSCFRTGDNSGHMAGAIALNSKLILEIRTGERW